MWNDLSMAVPLQRGSSQEGFLGEKRFLPSCMQMFGMAEKTGIKPS
ncbi:MAG: hypothetical protein AB9903_17575 [Vulcanimicrobiota bacterium]